MAGPLEKYFHLNDKNISGFHLDQDSEDKLVDVGPSVWNILFSGSKELFRRRC
jgi:hypothetical protein